MFVSSLSAVNSFELTNKIRVHNKLEVGLLELNIFRGFGGKNLIRSSVSWLRLIQLIKYIWLCIRGATRTSFSMAWRSSRPPSFAQLYSWINNAQVFSRTRRDKPERRLFHTQTFRPREQRVSHSSSRKSTKWKKKIKKNTFREYLRQVFRLELMIFSRRNILRINYCCVTFDPVNIDFRAMGLSDPVDNVCNFFFFFAFPCLIAENKPQMEIRFYVETRQKILKESKIRCELLNMIESVDWEGGHVEEDIRESILVSSHSMVTDKSEASRECRIRQVPGSTYKIQQAFPGREHISIYISLVCSQTSKFFGLQKNLNDILLPLFISFPVRDSGWKSMQLILEPRLYSCLILWLGSIALWAVLVRGYDSLVTLWIPKQFNYGSEQPRGK